MLKNLDKSILQNIFNSNEFKAWLLSRRWFGDKSTLANLEFKVSFGYFHIISECIFLTVIEITKANYLKKYFLPLIYYKKIQKILLSSEKERDNIIKLTENTFTKKIVIQNKVFTLNLLEAEYCIYFWNGMLFDKAIAEKFPSLSLDLTLYEEQFETEQDIKNVQNLIEASLFPDRYNISLAQLGKGNTTNLLFQLELFNKKEATAYSYVLKSYKEYSSVNEPSMLFVLVKNKFPYSPNIYGIIKVDGKESIGIMQDVPNQGNIGDIYWKEVSNLIFDVFKNINADYSEFENEAKVKEIIKTYCGESLVVSDLIGDYIQNLHNSLILEDEPRYSKEKIDSKPYLDEYNQMLNSMLESIKNTMNKKREKAFYNLPKINSVLIDTKDLITKFHEEFKEETIEIQPVHQDLHMEQILYNKQDGDYKFYFIDFEGDPQLSPEERNKKFPVEKDLASYLRSLSYIKFNIFLKFIEKYITSDKKYGVPEEELYNMFFRKAYSKSNEILETILEVLNQWEFKMMTKILNVEKYNPSITLINYHSIERVLHEIQYEMLYRPSEIIVPILGLKEITERN
ncbi:MAG: hypothetical protein GF383_03370 [Candidatus Lokiarchaeota archaeon]|nr:hypothetical protein [Candidatus Lokiarchaeota archaeon]MBD3338674.1 hypothetical protein [Candidatus Lokiarchaeota archaeon]